MKKQMVSVAPWLLVLATGLLVLRAESVSPGSLSAQEKEKISSLLGKVPESLEAMLERALDTNPDILVAQAKLQEAQAELNQIRLQVTEGIVSSYNLRRRQKLSVDAAASRVKVVEQQHRAGTISSDKLTIALMARLDAETALVQTEAKLRYLLGAGGRVDFVSARPEEFPVDPEPSRPTRPDIPKRFEEHLTATVSLSVEETSLAEVLASLGAMTSCNIVFDQDLAVEELTITLSVKELPLSSVLLMIHDTTGASLVFVFREYGILVTHEENAATMKSATIPADAYLEEE